MILMNPCRRDSGSPSYRENFVQVGLVSFSRIDCPPDRPEIHTRISSVRWWISFQGGAGTQRLPFELQGQAGDHQVYRIADRSQTLV